MVSPSRGGGRSSNGVEGRAGAGRGTRVESGVGGKGQVAGLAEAGRDEVGGESILSRFRRRRGGAVGGSKEAGEAFLASRVKLLTFRESGKRAAGTLSVGGGLQKARLSPRGASGPANSVPRGHTCASVGAPPGLGTTRPASADLAVHGRAAVTLADKDVSRPVVLALPRLPGRSCGPGSVHRSRVRAKCMQIGTGRSDSSLDPEYPQSDRENRQSVVEKALSSYIENDVQS